MLAHRSYLPCLQRVTLACIALATIAILVAACVEDTAGMAGRALLEHG